MKVLLLTILISLISASSFAGNVDLNNGVEVGFGSRSNSQRSFLQDFICRTNPSQCENLRLSGIVGEESRTSVSNDPKNREAQLAESIGIVDFCNRDGGELFLVSYNRKPYLVGSAHGFYNRDGTLKCSEDATLYLDVHYQGNTSGIDPFKGYTVEMPPLNHESARRFADPSLFDEDTVEGLQKNRGATNLNDMVIFELSPNDPLLNNQTGGQRLLLKISSLTRENIQTASTYNQTILIANHANFNDGLTTAIEKGCSIKASRHFMANLTSCDAGDSSSGAPMMILDKTGEHYVAGLIIGGTLGQIDESAYGKGEGGTFIMPVEQIRSQFEKYVGTESNREHEEY